MGKKKSQKLDRLAEKLIEDNDATNQFLIDANKISEKKMAKEKKKKEKEEDSIRKTNKLLGLHQSNDQLTKRTKRRLKKIIEKKQSLEKRNKIFEELQKNRLSEEDLNKLQSSVRLANGVLKKKKLKNKNIQDNIEVNDDEIELNGKMIIDERDENDAKKEDIDEVLIMEQNVKKNEENNEKLKEELLLKVNKDLSTKRKDEKEMKMRDSSSKEKRIWRKRKMELEETRKLLDVNRSIKMQEHRYQLPIMNEEANILDKLERSDVLFVCGQTGCGKSTQLPQILAENGYCEENNEKRMKIIVTQPRRVAAIHLADRVGEEMNMKDRVAYQVRYEKRTNESSLIEFVTEGILLKMIESDFLLKSFSAVILDEVHERSVHTDLLLSLLSRIVIQRRKKSKTDNNFIPLKLLIMSATLEVNVLMKNEKLFPDRHFRYYDEYEDEEEYLGKKKMKRRTLNLNENEEDSMIPLIKVESRQFPVAIHFSKTSPPSHAEMINRCLKKIEKINEEMPPGVILIFLPCRRDILHLSSLIRKLKVVESNTDGKKDGKNEIIPSKKIEKKNAMLLKNLPIVDFNRLNDTLKQLCTKDDEIETKEETKLFDEEQVPYSADDLIEDNIDDDDDDDDDDDEKIEVNEIERERNMERNRFIVYPFYSLQSQMEQNELFKCCQERQEEYEKDPESVKNQKRIVIVATNIAETSLTIPGVRYIIDSGLVKRKHYHVEQENVIAPRYVTEWTSKASAEQRTGRAGRLASGHCFRLYSSAVFSNEFPDHCPPQILDIPSEHLMLLLKKIGIDNVRSFPFPSMPSPTNLNRAEELLVNIGALKKWKIEKEKEVTRITKLGRHISLLSISPLLSGVLVRYMDNVQKRLKSALSTKLSKMNMDNIWNKRILLFLINLIVGISSDQLLMNESNEKLNESAKQIRTRWLNDQKSNDVKLLGDFFIYIFVISSCDLMSSKREVELFCRLNYIRLKSLKESRMLRRQICEMINKSYPWLKLTRNHFETAATICIDGEEAREIRRIICNGIALHHLAVLNDEENVSLKDCQLSKEKEEIEKDENDEEEEILEVEEIEKKEKEENKIIGNSYLTINSNIYSIPFYNSVLSSTKHPFLIYFNSIYTTRLNIMNICPINEIWLVDILEDRCLHSKPLHFDAVAGSYQPIYDKSNDEIKVYCKIRLQFCQREIAVCNQIDSKISIISYQTILNRRREQMNEMRITLKNTRQIKDRKEMDEILKLKEIEYRQLKNDFVQIYSRHLLNGDVFNELSQFQPFLTVNPQILIKKNVMFPLALQKLMKALKTFPIVDRQSLTDKWKNQKNFLFVEYSNLLKSLQKEQLKSLWPPIILPRKDN
ncbi:hypothetical protein SNEBB_008577 [Seison nebaliae]|nr:hypothetical protein SNEBB_008577 [Seison nebaliae]